ncbi:MAG: hypothetical protein DI537_23760 [Stutzerimonas stutzeri]|nr:MAG: hypothetical protein DI537_23760 [Stutzerimonas stutzeri]
MPWVRFARDFDWRPKRRVIIAHQRGHTILVTSPCAKAAVASGAGEIVEKPSDADRSQHPAP